MFQADIIKSGIREDDAFENIDGND